MQMLRSTLVFLLNIAALVGAQQKFNGGFSVVGTICYPPDAVRSLFFFCSVVAKREDYIFLQKF